MRSRGQGQRDSLHLHPHQGTGQGEVFPLHGWPTPHEASAPLRQNHDAAGTPVTSGPGQKEKDTLSPSAGSGSSVVCPYCQSPAQFLKSSADLYAGKDYGPAYVCWRCEAWVGCHRGTTRPLGRLANKQLRKAKQAAHRAFDVLWKDGWTRKDAYAWLARTLKIKPEDCHIGMFDEGRCWQTVRVCHTLEGRRNTVEASIIDHAPTASEPSDGWEPITSWQEPRTATV